MNPHYSEALLYVLDLSSLMQKKGFLLREFFKFEVGPEASVSTQLFLSSPGMNLP